MADQNEIQGVRHQVKMGLGEAVLRLVHIEVAYANNLDVADHLVEERNLIVEALNQYELDVGFDCNDDGVPDTVEVFQQSAETSCCRILPLSMTTSRTRSTGSSRRKKRGGSRG